MSETRDVERAKDLLLDAFGRVHEELPGVVEGLSPDELLWRPDAEANPVGWLVWHLARVQDDHLAGLGDLEQVWTSQGWAERFGLPYEVTDLGYGQDSRQVAAFGVADTGLLVGYHEAVHALTESVVRALDDLDRVVDRSWDPPVTAAVRLVSVVNDITQHLGQAAYLRGLLERRRP